MSPYWICQLVGWTLEGLVTVAVPTLYGGLRWVVVGRAIVGAVLGVLLTHRLRNHMRQRGWLQLPLRRLLPRVTTASIAIALVMFAAVLPFLVRFIPPNRSGPLAAVFLGHVALILIWSGIYLTVHYLRGLRSAEAEQWRLQLALRDAELRMLKAQVDPHFLFNSLNSLRALVSEDPGRAQHSVTGLAALLRFALRSGRAPTLPLERDLEAARHYLELEALRFESRLQFQIEVDPEALPHPVPPMLLLTLVENAIKHGISRLPEGGRVTIEARRDPGALRIRVTNSGSLQVRAGGGGIGLSNSLERLRLTFGEEARLVLTQAGPGEVRCEVTVPSPADAAIPHLIGSGIER